MTPKEIAQWMVDELQRERVLHQEHVVHVIATEFGKEFVYINENGNPALDRRVLREFRRITEGTVMWVGGDYLWRFRREYDPPGKRQAED